jgi:hypothetical protein
VRQGLCRAPAIPISTHSSLEKIGKLVESCLIFHNIMVEEHVMGTHTERYFPSHGVHVDRPDHSDPMGKLASNRVNVASKDS